MGNIKLLKMQLDELEALRNPLNFMNGVISIHTARANKFLEEKAGLVDEDWEEHKANHSSSPSMNCSYCVENADMPEEEVSDVAF